MNTNYYIFIVSDRMHNGKKISGKEVYDFLMEKNAWGLHPTTQHRTLIKEGDKIIFYLAGVHGGFAGLASIKSNAYIDKTGESKDWWFNKSEINYRVDLEDVQKWEKLKPIQPLLEDLFFIKKTKNWGVYLQGGVRKINEDDYSKILKSDIYDVLPVKKKTISETVSLFDSNLPTYEPHLLSSPERVKISRIIENVERGWKIPNFQRYFDWKREDIRSFLESIFNDYYVGSFLLWKVSSDPNVEVEPIKGVSKNEFDVERIILDGQQRMTALYYAIKEPKFGLKGSTKKKSYFFVDLQEFLEDGTNEDLVVVKEKKISIEESYKELLFPFYELSNFSEWVYGFEDYLEGQINDRKKTREIKKVIEQRLRHFWEGFEIPYVVLPESMELVHVANIFEKINSKGKPLSTFDLLIARLLRYKIKLKDLWDKACEDYQNIERYAEETDKTKMAIFYIMSLLYHPTSSCKRKDILNIYESLTIDNIEQFSSYWNTCCEAFNNAIIKLENMRDGLGVRSEKDIPFYPAIAMIAAFLVRIKDTDNQSDAMEKVNQWYWSSCITGNYSSGVESKMTMDFKEVNNWFDNENDIPTVVKIARERIDSINLIDVNEQSSSVYKAILSLVALKGSKDFASNQNLENARENQKDHIFPKATKQGFGKNKNIDSVINMTWMSSDTNMFIKKAKKPSEYINHFIVNKFNNNEEKFKECLESHIISEDEYTLMKKDDFDLFLQSRARKIKKDYREKIGALSEVEVKINKSPSDLLDNIEEKVRSLIDDKLKNERNDYWEELIPQGVRDGVKEKIKQHNKKHPSETGKERSSLEKLSFCHIMDYYTIIVNKKNWALFENIFSSKPETEKHFSNINDYRNCIKHKREMNNVVKKSGEASLEWLYPILKK